MKKISLRVLGKNNSDVETASPKRVIKKRYIISAFFVVSMLVGTVAYYIIESGKNDNSGSDPVPYVAPVDRLLKTPEPADATDKLNYYSDLAIEYEAAGEYRKAVDSFIKADSLITDRSANGRSVNNGIARLYEKLDDKLKARQYYQRELDRVKDIPDNQEMITFLQNKIKQL